MSREARRMPRRTVVGLVSVMDAMCEESIGHIANLSAGGMLLIANRPMADDALYQIRFCLPEGQGVDFEVGAHVLWCDGASAPGQSWAGLRFLGLEPDTARRLREWSQAGVSGTEAP